jgi:transposase InsO family protein
MPWKYLSLVEARRRFVELVFKAQEPFVQLCHRFHISRKTGYKWKERFLAGGGRNLRDQSRRPKRPAHSIQPHWIARIRQLRRRRRHWGSRKIWAYLRRQYPHQRVPAVRTISRYHQRLKLSGARRRPQRKGPLVVRSALSAARRSNQVWTVDFKGWFRTRNGQRVEPLTVRDLFSRYLLAIVLLPDQQWRPVRAVFMRLFGKYGLPAIIRVDNGGPFASRGPAGLSRLSAWWTALGIRVEFIDPGHPEQNAGHEQMHRVMKAETTRPVSSTMRAQQRRTNRWLWIYNHERPHEALGQRPPVWLYQVTRPQSAPRVELWKYAKGWDVRSVRSNGQIRWLGRLRFIGEAFVGYKLGLKRLSNGHWSVYFRSLLLGELHASDAGGLRPSAYVRQHPTKPKQV